MPMINNKIFTNVAFTTIAKALGRRSRFREKIQSKIFGIDCKHKSRLNALRIAMKQKTNQNIAILVCQEQYTLWGEPFYSRIFDGIKSELSINDYDPIFSFLFQNNPDKLPTILQNLSIIGIIVIGHFNGKSLRKIKRLNLPTIYIDPQTQINDCSRVLINNEDGAFNATQYLINAGHRKISFISNGLYRLSIKQRYRGYIKALKYYSIQIDKVLIQTDEFNDRYQHIKDMLINRQPTAIFVVNDTNALITYRAIHELQLKIPDDISVIGFDDIHLSHYLIPALTTIQAPKEKMGSMAVRTLFRQINNGVDDHSTIIMPVEIIERESVTDYR